MSETPKIVDLVKVVEPHLDGGQLDSYTSRYLTKPGDNYGSIMLSIAATVKRPDNTTVMLPLIAKLPPLTNDLYWQIFKPERTCVTENTVYKYLAPELRNLQLEAGVEEDEIFDAFPQYYGSRISLEETAAKVDRNAVLVQENAQISGYKAGNRHRMYDYAHTELVLEYMAQFHALPIALRLKKPEVYDKYVRPYFHKFNMNSNMTADVIDELNRGTLRQVEIATNNNEKALERFKELLQCYENFLSQPNDPADGLFTTVAHFDLWINNIMIKYDANGAPQKLKIVDFQIAQYESVVHDVIFFLFSSVDTDVLEQHYDEFLRKYYNAFVHCLERVDVQTGDYSYELFLDEVKRVAPIEIPHAIFMTKIILADNSTMPDDFKDVDVSIIGKNLDVAEITKKTADIIKLAQKFKLFV